MIPRAPVCVPCARVMQIDRNDVSAIELLPDGTEYRVWSADRWKCPMCERTALVGFGRKPIAERGLPGFDRELEEARTYASTVEVIG